MVQWNIPWKHMSVILFWWLGSYTICTSRRKCWFENWIFKYVFLKIYWSQTYKHNQCLSPLSLWAWTPRRRIILDTSLCDKVCQWLGTGRWFCPGTPMSSTNKTDRHDILLKVALNTINYNLNPWTPLKSIRKCISFLNTKFKKKTEIKQSRTCKTNVISLIPKGPGGNLYDLTTLWFCDFDFVYSFTMTRLI